MEELIRLQKTLQQILGDNSPTKVLANKGIILDLKSQSPIYEWSSPFAWYEKNRIASTARILSIGSPLANAIITKDFSYLDTFCKTLSMFDALKVDTISPLVSWYQSFQFTQHIFDLLQIPHTTREKFKEVEARYQQALFDCKWFPNAGEHVDVQIMDEILGIFKSSKPKSERCERRIDKVVFQIITIQE